jgi:hypothetical protein
MQQRETFTLLSLANEISSRWSREEAGARRPRPSSPFADLLLFTHYFGLAEPGELVMVTPITVRAREGLPPHPLLWRKRAVGCYRDGFG